MSSAIGFAISSFVRTPLVGDWLIAQLLWDEHDAVDVDARSHDVLGIQGARPHDVDDLGEVAVAAVAITGPKLRAVLR
jgi:hypothetical protein